MLGLIGFSTLVNFVLWRRYFYSRYKYEDTDPLFSAYATKFSRTASVVTFLSYLVTFQAIRLAYSRFLGKKQFSAGFTRRRRYYRLIGRLTVFEAIFMYGPAIALNIYNLTYMTDRKEMQYWMNIDSLALQAYALLLIIVVLILIVDRLSASATLTTIMLNWSMSASPSSARLTIFVIAEVVLRST